MLRRGKTYTYEQAYELCEKYYNDSPYLETRVPHPKRGDYLAPIQNSHMTKGEMFIAFAGTEWTFLYVTHEEIPIFVSCSDIDDRIEYEFIPDPIYEHKRITWVYPKAHPRPYNEEIL